MSKFKVGDRVRYVSTKPTGKPLRGHKFGHEFTVARIHPLGDAVFLDPPVMNSMGAYSWYEDHFELVTEPELEWTEVEAKDLKKGEKVQYLGVEWGACLANQYGASLSHNDTGDSLILRPNTTVKALRPKPLELPTEPLSVFWGRVERDGETYEGVIVVDNVTPYYLAGRRVGGLAVHGERSVARLPWPKDELEKFKAGLK